MTNKKFSLTTSVPMCSEIDTIFNIPPHRITIKKTYYSFIILIILLKALFFSINTHTKYTNIAITISTSSLIHTACPENSLWHKTSVSDMKNADVNIEKTSLQHILTLIVLLVATIMLMDTVNSAMTEAIAAPFCVRVGINR